MGKFRAQAVARFRGFSEARAKLVGKDQLIFRRIQQLARAEEHTRERRDQPDSPGAIRPMKNQYGVRDAARGIAPRRPQRCIVQPHFRQCLPVRKFKIVRDEIAFLGLQTRHRRILLRARAKSAAAKRSRPDNAPRDYLSHLEFLPENPPADYLEKRRGSSRITATLRCAVFAIANIPMM
jgi:hypothetical protein